MGGAVEGMRIRRPLIVPARAAASRSGREPRRAAFRRAPPVARRRACARFSKELNLGDFLFLGKGTTGHAAVPSNLLADVYESLVAAIYLDGGLEAAREFILRHLGPEIEEVAEAAHAGNFKSVLQQVAQREFSATPLYLLLDENGPDHSKCFKIAAEING